MLAGVIARDRMRLAWILASLLIVGFSSAGLLTLAETGMRATMGELVDAYRPHIKLYVTYNDPERLVSLRESYVSIMSKLASTIESRPLPLESVEDYTAYPVVEVAVYFRRAPEPSGAFQETGDWRYAYQTEILAVPSEAVGGAIRYTPLMGSRVLAALIPSEDDADAAGYRIIEGSFPASNMPGVVEAAVSKTLAEYFGVGPGDYLDLAPGMRIYVTGVFSSTRESAVIGDGGIVHLIVNPSESSDLAEAITDWIKELAVEDRSLLYVDLLYMLVGAAGVDYPLQMLGLREVSLDVGEGIIPGDGLLALLPVREAVDRIIEVSGLNVTSDVREALYELAAESLLERDQFLVVAINLKTSYILSLPAEARTPITQSRVHEELVGQVNSILGWLQDLNVSIPSYTKTLVSSGIPSKGQVIVVPGNQAGSGLILAGPPSTALYDIYSIYANPLASPVLGFSTATLVIISFMLGIIVATDVLRVVLSDIRVHIALLVARGSSHKVLARSFLKLLIAASILMALAGSILSVTVAWRGRGSLIAPSALALILTLTVGLLTYKRTSGIVRQVNPIEVLRPIEVGYALEKPRPRLNAFLLVLSLDSIVVGLLGGPQRLFEAAQTYGTAVASMVAIVVFVGMMFSIIAPAAIAYATASFLGGLEVLFARVARLAGRYAGQLSWTAIASASRLRYRLASGLTAPIIGVGVAVGALLGASSLASVSNIGFNDFLLEGRVFEWDPALIVGYRALSNYILPSVSLTATAMSLLSLYILAHSARRIVEAELIVARARGASRSDTLRLSASILLPISMYSLLAGSAVAASFHVAIVAVGRLSSLGSVNVPLPPSPSLTLLLGVPLIVAASLGVPLLLSLASATGDLARALRRLVYR